MNATRVATGWWVYGVVPSDAAVEELARAEGVGSAPVRLVRAAGLAALTGEVPLDEFDEEGLRRNLEDPVWLEEQARAHDAVLAGALARSPLVPLRFGVVYRSEDGVRQMLELRAPELEATLARVAGRVELGVKAFLVDRGEQRAAAASGREYLLRKQEERRRAAEADAQGSDVALELHERLAAHAQEARANRPQRPELSGRRERMILNGVYLVAVDRQDAFAGAVDALRRVYESHGVLLELTGPWPPYNFAGEDE